MSNFESIVLEAQTIFFRNLFLLKSSRSETCIFGVSGWFFRRIESVDSKHYQTVDISWFWGKNVQLTSIDFQNKISPSSEKKLSEKFQKKKYLLWKAQICNNIENGPKIQRFRRKLLYKKELATNIIRASSMMCLKLDIHYGFGLKNIDFEQQHCKTKKTNDFHCFSLVLIKNHKHS